MKREPISPSVAFQVADRAHAKRIEAAAVLFDPVVLDVASSSRKQEGLSSQAAKGNPILRQDPWSRRWKRLLTHLLLTRVPLDGRVQSATSDLLLVREWEASALLNRFDEDNRARSEHLRLRDLCQSTAR